MQWDLLIRGARVFDGTAGPGEMLDLAIKDGRVSAKGAELPTSAAARVHEAAGSWLIPGLLDIHTHEDLEVELAPGLPEVVRHGTTSVVVGNCSLGLAFGNQRRGNQDPIVD
ncbi:MAG: aminoacylase, partial [Anaerolineae bacterium]